MTRSDGDEGLGLVELELIKSELCMAFVNLPGDYGNLQF